MTFEEFQKTRTYCQDLRPITEFDESRDGYVYTYKYPNGDSWTGLYIEMSEDGGYYLILDNQDWITSDLESLERKLFEYADVELGSEFVRLNP